MIDELDFENMVVFDLANNHQGSVERGLAIIDQLAKLERKTTMQIVIKFQFRDLDTFIHPSHRRSSDNKHVPRFLSTRLSWKEFETLKRRIDSHGLISMCTPFDEESVDRVQSLNFDVIKVASCSASDWPLLTKIAGTGKPVIASTGGLDQNGVDNLVSFLCNRGVKFALMHCVSIYPTPDHACNLANIATFKKRYAGITIGWSTHESPDEIMHVGLAYALGARIFERHVGINDTTHSLNAYSSDAKQLGKWLDALERAIVLLGSSERPSPSSEEIEAIEQLKRAVFAKKDIAAGGKLRLEDCYFAFPYVQGAVSSGSWTEGMVANVDLAKDAPVLMNDLAIPPRYAGAEIKSAIHEVKALLNYAGVTLTEEFQVEYSHHYGISKFRDIGAVLISIINREYCKKIIVQLPNQSHPLHYHRLKEETFLVLYGELYSELNGTVRLTKPGETILVLPGVWHRFWTTTGVVFEEISTTHYSDDSVYQDDKINALSSNQRKTVVDHWGRFQIDQQLI